MHGQKTLKNNHQFQGGMRILHVAALSTADIPPPDEALSSLPERIGLAATVQHLATAEGIARRLRRMGKSPLFLKGAHAACSGQVLGCSTFPESELSSVDAILFIGSGSFHAKALSFRTGKSVITYNPLSGEMAALGQDDIDALRKRERAGLAAFHAAKRVGVLFSTKSGQSALQLGIGDAETLASRFPDKEFFLLVDNTLSLQALEDFPFIDCFVNTACPNLAFDEGFPRPVVNAEALPTF